MLRRGDFDPRRVSGPNAADHHLLARPALDGVENRPVEAGAPVELHGERLGPRRPLEGAVECRGAHREDGVPVLLRLYERDALLVLPRDPRQLSHEVRRAGASDGLPYPAGILEGAGAVCPVAPLALPVADVPGQELDDVLARVAARPAHLVEDAGPPRLPGVGVGAALFSDVF